MGPLWSPRWIASHAFAAVATAVMIGLGFWQLDRLGQRQAANTEIRDVMGRAPVDLAVVDLPAAGTPAGSAQSGSPGLLDDYSAVTASGVYIADAEVLIGHRSYQSQPGSWLATPLKLADGRVAVVVRGWVPRRTLAGVDTRTTDPPAGTVAVTGLAFASQPGARVGRLSAGGAPELSRVDLKRFEEVTGIDVIGMWMRLTDQAPPQSDLPVPVGAPDLSDGPHLSYAFQWFFFAAGAAVVYALILRRAIRVGRVAQLR